MGGLGIYEGMEEAASHDSRSIQVGVKEQTESTLLFGGDKKGALQRGSPFQEQAKSVGSGCRCHCKENRKRFRMKAKRGWRPASAI